MMKKIILKRGKEESLLRFHPWVFSGAIQQADKDIEEGELVRAISSLSDTIRSVPSPYVSSLLKIPPSTRRSGSHDYCRP